MWFTKLLPDNDFRLYIPSVSYDQHEKEGIRYMLDLLWKRINYINLQAESKFRIFRIALEIPAGLTGLLLWLIIRSRYLQTRDWMVCFIGYPIIISWFISILFICRHPFQNGSTKNL